MNPEYERIVKEYEPRLSRQQNADELSAFLELLFDKDDSVQIKEVNRIHPADAVYASGSTANKGIHGMHSASGVQFCMNAVPAPFLEKLEYLCKVESLCDSQWDRMIPELRDELLLSAALFDCGRTFFIEADDLPNGDSIKTVDDKVTVLNALLSSDLPISYILDTGGRGPHIGIVLAQTVSKIEFDKIVKAVMSRLPPWIDSGVGRVNQLERMPNTTRVNKLGEVVEVKTIHVGQRIKSEALLRWIDEHPIINESVNQESHLPEDNYIDNEIDLDDAESAAWKFISEHNLKSSKLRGGKIQVGCPKAQNHKSGRDKNMSAFIKVDSGLVWCSACKETVGWTIPISQKLRRHGSPLIQSHETAQDLSMLKPSKLF